MLAIDYYRIYSRATKGGGAVIKSTSAGGGTHKSTSAGGGISVTSSSGGGVSKSTASGGGTTQTSSAGGGTTVSSTFRADRQLVTGVDRAGEDGYSHYHNLYDSGHAHDVSIGSHSHSTQIPSHVHSFVVENHNHTVSANPHTHDIELNPHDHVIDIPPHEHEIEHGIFMLNRMPTKVTIKVDGNTVPHTALTGESIDLIPYLDLDSENRVRRGWHEVTIAPNDFGRVNAQVMTQFFMQSRGGVDA